MVKSDRIDRKSRGRTRIKVVSRCGRGRSAVKAEVSLRRQRDDCQRFGPDA
jgi:hypothetical protein